jgi:uncharacterized OsmC-like protein
LADTIRGDVAAGATTWAPDVAWRGAFRSTARIRGFAELPSDEPAGLGGPDSTPVEQLLAARGHCLAVGYAVNTPARGIEISDLWVQVRGGLDLHAFLGLRPGHAGFDTISAIDHLATDVAAVGLAALHQAVVATSPVGHTLKAPIPTTVRLATAP